MYYRFLFGNIVVVALCLYAVFNARSNTVMLVVDLLGAVIAVLFVALYSILLRASQGIGWTGKLHFSKRNKALEERLIQEKLEPCPKCGSNERVEAMGGLHMMVVRNPVKKQFMNGSPLDAIVCLKCGHTTFYARHPRHLVE